MDLHGVGQAAHSAKVDAERRYPVLVVLVAEVVGTGHLGDAAHRAIGANHDRGAVAALASLVVGTHQAGDVAAVVQEVGESETLHYRHCG